MFAPPSPPAVSRREWGWLAAIVAAGLIVRFAFPSHAVVEHYDEGVYASNLYQPDGSGAYPDRHLYAPPLWPAVIEWTVLLFGPQAAAWPSMIAGGLLPIVCWQIARDVSGASRAGLVAAALAAFDPMLILYSRTALVDMPLTLLLATSIACAIRGVDRGRWGWLLAAGGAAGLAWATKYNGWLASAIPVAAAIAWGVGSRRVWTATRVLVVPAIAALAFGVVLFGLRETGGYGPVAANHARYFGGFSQWLANAATQVANAAGLWAITAATLPVALVAAIWPLLRFREATFGQWTLAAWLISLTLAIPLYAPYPRLLVPLLPAIAIGVGVAVGRLSLPPWSGRLPIPLGLAAAVTVIAGSPALRPRTAAAFVADAVVGNLTREPLDGVQGFAVYVLSEPGAFFQLAARQDAARPPYVAIPAGSLIVGDAAGTPPGLRPMLLIGPHAAADGIADVGRDSRFALVGTIDARPSRLVRLNRSGAGRGGILNDRYTLYRIVPVAESGEAAE